MDEPKLIETRLNTRVQTKHKKVSVCIQSTLHGGVLLEKALLLYYKFLLLETGYNRFQRKKNCTRKCGNIDIPYPFGLEEDCSARKLFQLNCTDMSSSSLQLNDNYHLKYIKFNEGLLGIEDTSYIEDMYRMHLLEEPQLYICSGESASIQWAVANLTCQEAQQNKSGYACVIVNSTCLPVDSTYGYIGYRCECRPGFQGNPYVQDGCQGYNLSLFLRQEICCLLQLYRISIQ